MKIAIVGAGIVGVTTAYALSQDGHAVTVFEQRSSAAEEASFANGALLGPHLLRPWAAPGSLGLARPTLFGRQALVRIASGASRTDLAWLWHWRSLARRTVQEPLPSIWQQQLQLTQYSQSQLHAQCAQLQLSPEMRSGALVLLRSEAEHNALAPQLRLLRDAGIPVHELDAAAARLHEPGLAESAPLAGALQLPNAELGNCRLYAQQLRQAAQALGAQFQFGSTVRQIQHSPPGVQLQGQETAQRFDAVVLCAGSAASALARPLGLALPLAQLHGYTVSTLLRDELQAPHAAVIDASARVSIARLGQRLRIAGGAELGGSGSPHHQPTLERLYQVLTDWFPGGAQLSGGVQVWRGTRSMSADGLPLLGPSTLPGLWLNCGHGDSGWALASGCAQLLADSIAGRSPALDISPLALR